MHKLISFVICNNPKHHVSRIIVHLYLRGLLLRKMSIREQPMEERKRTQYDLQFTFCLTHPVTANTSTVTKMTQLVPAGNVDCVTY